MVSVRFSMNPWQEEIRARKRPKWGKRGCSVRACPLFVYVVWVWLPSWLQALILHTPAINQLSAFTSDTDQFISLAVFQSRWLPQLLWWRHAPIYSSWFNPGLYCLLLVLIHLPACLLSWLKPGCVTPSWPCSLTLLSWSCHSSLPSCPLPSPSHLAYVILNKPVKLHLSPGFVALGSTFCTKIRQNPHLNLSPDSLNLPLLLSSGSTWIPILTFNLFHFHPVIVLRIDLKVIFHSHQCLIIVLENGVYL